MDPTIAELAWLVENRSRNQDYCLRLYKCLVANRSAIESGAYESVAGYFVSIAFSLWRAVFLADVRDFGEFIADYEKFLMKLVHHNSVSYTSDREARHFSVVYYTDNARLRLAAIAREGRYLPAETDLTIIKADAQAVWIQCQTLAETALGALEAILQSASNAKK